MYYDQPLWRNDMPAAVQVTELGKQQQEKLSSSRNSDVHSVIWSRRRCGSHDEQDNLATADKFSLHALEQWRTADPYGVVNAPQLQLSADGSLLHVQSDYTTCFSSQS